MQALRIHAGDATPITLPAGGDHLAALQAEVGGWITSAFTCRRPGSDTELTGYVDDEGLMKQIPVNVILRHANGYTQPTVGPLVVLGLDPATGESVGLTDDDIAYVQQQLSWHPVYVYDGQYLFTDVAVLRLPESA